MCGVHERLSDWCAVCRAFISDWCAVCMSVYFRLVCGVQERLFQTGVQERLFQTGVRCA